MYSNDRFNKFCFSYSSFVTIDLIIIEQSLHAYEIKKRKINSILSC